MACPKAVAFGAGQVLAAPNIDIGVHLCERAGLPPQYRHMPYGDGLAQDSHLFPFYLSPSDSSEETAPAAF